MSDWDPTQAPPDQLGDCFAALYDWITPEVLTWIVNFGWARQFAKSPARPRLIEAVARSGWSTPQEIRDYLAAARAGSAEEIAFAVYVAAKSIDQGVHAHHPVRSGTLDLDASLTLSSYYDIYGRYNDTSGGYVLPKRGDEGKRGQSLSNQFEHLLRARVDRRHVRVFGGAHARYPGSLKAPSIVVVPFLYSLADAGFKGLSEHGEDYFKVVLKLREELHERVRGAVRDIRAIGSTIAIFPELALVPDLLQTLQSALRETDKDDHELAWVIAGMSSPAPRQADFNIYNSAHVLDSHGRLVAKKGNDLGWEQRKRHMYTLTASEQERYGLEDEFAPPPLTDRKEAISIGSGIFVFETRWGRYAVLICEEWARDEDTFDQVKQLNCRVLLVLVMDGRVSPKRWVSKRYDFYGDEHGGSVFIANSLLLPYEESRKRERDIAAGLPVHTSGEPAEDPGRPAVGILLLPADNGTSHTHSVLVHAQASGEGGPATCLISDAASLPGDADGLRSALDAVK